MSDVVRSTIGFLTDSYAPCFHGDRFTLEKEQSGIFWSDVGSAGSENASSICAYKTDTYGGVRRNFFHPWQRSKLFEYTL